MNSVAAEAAASLPENPEIQFELGKTQYKQKNYREAIAALDAALALDPQHYQAMTYKAMSQYFLGEKETAIATFRSSLAIRPYWVTYSNLGKVYLAEGKVAEAVAVVQDWLKLEPTSEEAHKRFFQAVGEMIRQGWERRRSSRSSATSPNSPTRLRRRPCSRRPGSAWERSDRRALPILGPVGLFGRRRVGGLALGQQLAGAHARRRHELLDALSRQQEDPQRATLHPTSAERKVAHHVAALGGRFGDPRQHRGDGADGMPLADRRPAARGRRATRRG